MIHDVEGCEVEVHHRLYHESRVCDSLEAAKETIWFWNFLLDLDVIPNLPCKSQFILA